ncbi:MAG: ATPase [Bacteroidetes bacterium]|jgi:hypothetical protein|nr:ATPase [Bacteroidota bacterium]
MAKQSQRRGRLGEFKGTIGQRERFKSERHDVYQEQKKWPEPTRCPTCGAAFMDGRWTWETAPPSAQEVECPACRRIADAYPAGFVEIAGTFFEAHREELIGLIRNAAALEKGEHPLERLMAIERDEDAEAPLTLVTTTGVHLARRIGDALARAYEGDLTIQYGDAEHQVRVHWARDAD